MNTFVDVSGHRYKLDREIGFGTYGVVYQASREESIYAIKVMQLNSLAINETSIMKIVDHPNIIKYIDMEVRSNLVYIVMPYGEGDLHGRIFDRQKTKDIIFQILCGIHHMHESGIMHRDIKPSNIVMVDGVPTIIDFSLSVYMKESTDTNVVTLPWRHPSLIAGIVPYDIRIDIWSVGVLMYNLLTGKYLSPEKDDKYKYIESVIASHPEGIEWNDRYNYIKDPVESTSMVSYMRNDGIDKEEVDIIMYMLRMDIKNIPLAIECLVHPYFKDREIIYSHPVPLPSPYPIDGISSRARKIILDWILEVQKELRLQDRLITNTIVLFDRYQRCIKEGRIARLPLFSSIRSGEVIPNDEIQICATASLYLSCTIMEDIDMFDRISNLIPGMGATELQIYTKHIYSSVQYQVVCYDRKME